jgi:acetyltransferase-like isoleucine patch superfamily enzyme
MPPSSSFNHSLFPYFLARARKTPHLLKSGILAWLRGWWYRCRFFVFGQRFHAGKWFRVYGPLYITGPGRVLFGDNCLVISNAIKPVCIRTLTRDAAVNIGDHAGLNGTSIQCVNRVSIGRLSNLADAYITDSPAHSLGKQRRMETVEDIAASPVIIGENVWISVQVVILDGVTIGDNTVIGACSLVRKDVPANVFAAGNPLNIIHDIQD